LNKKNKKQFHYVVYQPPVLNFQFQWKHIYPEQDQQKKIIIVLNQGPKYADNTLVTGSIHFFLF